MSHFNTLNDSQKIEKLKIDGTTPAEVFILTFFVPLSSLLLWLFSYFFSVSNRFSNCLEVIIVHLILLLVLTVLNNHLLPLFIILGLFLLFSLYFKFQQLTSEEVNRVIKSIKSSSISAEEFNRKFVGDYRGHLLLATSICILAVDFPVFPTKFAKTESFGWSVMDAGVGSFVILHGLCSSHSKLHSPHKKSLKSVFLSSYPIFVLGFIRLALTTAVGYHKVISEYGKHWNFFFTLALTKVICSSILVTLNANSGLLAVITVISHQLLISKVGLSDLVLSDARRNIFEANKEGICSLLGFVSLYFCGVQIGRIIWKQRVKVTDYIFLLIQLCGIGLIGWMFMYILHKTVQPTSRRMANLTYCIWVVSLTSLQIAIHLCHRLSIIILESTFKIKLCGSFLWEVINFNGLFYFLLANIVTGFVNLVTNTGSSSGPKSLLILNTYLAFLYVSSMVLLTSKIKNDNSPVITNKKLM